MNVHATTNRLLLKLFLGVALILQISHAGAQDNPDKRAVIVLNHVEQDYVLSNMRMHLEDVQTIVNAFAANDMARAQVAAEHLGTHSFDTNKKRPDTLVPKLPQEFVYFMKSYHADFDTLAEGIRNREPQGLLLQRLGTAMQGCVACHASFRIVGQNQ
jgi:cytochrome c556